MGNERCRIQYALRAMHACVCEFDIRARRCVFVENMAESARSALSRREGCGDYFPALAAQLCLPGDIRRLSAAFRLAMRGQPSACRVRLLMQRAAPEWFCVQFLPLAAQRLLCIAQSIDRAQRKEEFLRRQLARDSFTHLYHKVSVQQLAARTLRAHPNEYYALLLFDLDHFKTFNDRFGHVVGDEILLAFSKQLSAAFRHRAIIGRFGGDEFLVFLHRDAHTPLNKAFSATCHLTVRGHSVSASVGVALYPEHGDSLASLLSHADAALYRSKRRRKKQPS